MALYTWQLDKEHSDIGFKMSHLLISRITGIFREFSGTIKTPETYSFNNAAFLINLDIFSIETNSIERNEQLKSDDFFNADIYPEIHFVSHSFIHLEGDMHTLSGSLTVKGITKPFMFNVIFGGYTKDGFGLNRAVFDITGTINRNDFNIHSGNVTEAGGLVLGEDIELHATLNFTFKPEETPNDY